MELSERQRQFADAALRVLARNGMSAVSYRAVAAESQMSLGAVQKAFPAKKLLLKAMFHQMRDNASRDHVADPGRPTLLDWLVELMVAILPLNEVRRAAELQGVAFTERAASDPEFGEAVASSDRELVDAIALLANRALSEGELHRSCDPEHIARAWLALGSGLAAQLLYDPRPEEEVRGDVRYAIEGLVLARPS